MHEIIREIGEKFKKYQIFKGNISYDEPLKNHTTMKVGGNAAVFVQPQDVVSAALVISACKKYVVPCFVLGGGSNLVFGDSGFSGVVLSTQGLNGISFTALSDGNVLLNCGAGVKNSGVSDFCMKKGFSGLESFAGLPGTCGGGAFMNARCYETSISDVLFSAKYLELDEIPAITDDDESLLIEGTEEKIESVENKLLKSAEKEYLMNISDWDYKKSPFMGGHRLLTQVCYKVSPLDIAVLENGQDALEEYRQKIQQKNRYYIQERVNKGHFKAPSAGSVFKNNHEFGKPSGKLIDEAGLKGTVSGGAQIAPWHGNFIINNGNASAADILNLVKLCQEKVKEQTGFFLEPEIIFV